MHDKPDSAEEPKDSPFFIAHTARARCDAGLFSLMGRTLRPLSALRAQLIEELLGYTPAEPGFEELEAISLICSDPRPRCWFPERDAVATIILGEKFAALDLAEQQRTWRLYWDACAGSQPPIRTVVGGSSAESGVPVHHYCVTAILREMHGISRAELWEEMPLAEMLWLFEGMREQRDGVTYIADDEAPHYDPTPESEAEDALAGKVLSAHFIAVAQARSLRDSDPDAGNAAWRAADAERDRLMALLAAGRLAADLTEIPAIVETEPAHV